MFVVIFSFLGSGVGEPCRFGGLVRDICPRLLMAGIEIAVDSMLESVLGGWRLSKVVVVVEVVEVVEVVVVVSLLSLISVIVDSLLNPAWWRCLLIPAAPANPLIWQRRPSSGGNLMPHQTKPEITSKQIYNLDFLLQDEGERPKLHIYSNLTSPLILNNTHHIT